ncbi:MAG: glycoside hydrolase family 18 protein [Clostridia bacterium]|nr:glycoside hydrolase family 18 protein [Clostridia bacterium]
MYILKRIWFEWRTQVRRTGGYLLSALMLLPGAVAFPVQIASASGASAAPSHGKAVIAYAFDAKAPGFADRDARYITHINWAFALIENGRVTGAHWRHIDKLAAYKRKHPHIKTLVAVGGWGADGFSQAAATPAGREAFVSSALALMQRHGFDGIDIDWEYPGVPAGGIAAGKDDKRNFTLLLRDLRRGLDAQAARDGKKRLLTIAVGASAANVSGIECAAVAPYLDYVNVMTYDMAGAGAGRRTGHHAAMYPSRPGDPSAHTALEAYERAGIPRSKLIVGAAFYGRMWKGVAGGGNNGLHQAAGDGGNATINYPSLMQNYFGKNGYRVYWDDGACAPYLYNGENFISFDNAESVRIKGIYARSRGLGGVMFWEYSLDPSGELLRAIDAGLRR